LTPSVNDTDVREFVIARAVAQHLNHALLCTTRDQLVVGDTGEYPSEAHTCGTNVGQTIIALVLENHENNHRYRRE